MTSWNQGRVGRVERTLAATLFVLMSACAHVAPISERAARRWARLVGQDGRPTGARVVLYRASCSGPPVKISLGGTWIGTLGSNDFALIEASPGSRHVTLLGGEVGEFAGFAWEALPGQTVFYRVTFPETNLALRILVGPIMGGSLGVAAERVTVNTALLEMAELDGCSDRVSERRFECSVDPFFRASRGEVNP